MSAIEDIIPIREYHPEFHKESILEGMRRFMLAQAEYVLNHLATYSSAMLTIGSGSAADIRINVAIDYVRDGLIRAQKAAAEVNVPAGAAMADDDTDREVVVLVYIDTDDAYAALAGEVANNGDEAEVPELPEGCVQIGYVRIAAAAGTAFVPDTTLLSAVGITDTYTSKGQPQQNWVLPMRAGYM